CARITTHRSRVIALLQATAQCAATFVRAVGRPNNDPLDRELHRCIAEERETSICSMRRRNGNSSPPSQPSNDIEWLSAPRRTVRLRHPRDDEEADLVVVSLLPGGLHRRLLRGPTGTAAAYLTAPATASDDICRQILDETSRRRPEAARRWNRPAF